MRTTVLLSVLLGIWLPLHAASVSGELRKWHKVTLSFEGPATSESASPNPFTNYRLDVTFRHAGSGKSYVVPGYYAADGNAADTSATSGNVWRAHFAPDETGTWTWEASFRSGTNVHAGTPGSGSSAGFFDGDSGNFDIAGSDKTGRDFRGKGRLQYVGKHHLRFAGTGEYFMKAGVDSPENLLSYADFDGDFKTDGEDDDLVKDWQPHVGDWRAGDPVWQGSKGKGLIGAINYLASEGLNSFSFLTMNIEGDDKNVFPYTGYDVRDRLDVSRLAQWEIVFEHGTRNGMYLHFKTQETENETLLDGGNTGTQRKLYYRELVARFGHHLALNWNLGEEIDNASTARKKAWAQYFHDVDPYDHHIVIHNGDSHFDLMGPDSELTGMSWQANASNFSDTFTNVLRYIRNSDNEGKPWVVACDEPGDARLSLRPDNDAGNSHTDARRDALWATCMAGGAGVEFYFGYDKPNSDLTCQDFRSRDAFWDYCRHALQFFASGAVPFQDMSNANPLVSSSGDNGNRCLAKAGQSYLVQLRSGGTHTLDLSGASGNFRVRWFDPRNGGSLISGTTVSGGGTVSLGTPPNSAAQDWIVLVDKSTGTPPENEAPVVSAGPDRSAILNGTSVSLALSGSATDDGLPDGNLTTSWSRVSGPAEVSFATPDSPSTNATFPAAGTYVLRLTASDGEFSRSDETTVSVTSSSGGGDTLSFGATQDAYTENNVTRNVKSIRVESSSRKRISYLQFDVQGFASATRATLKLTETEDDSAGTMTLRLYAALSNNWSESTIVPSTAPGKGVLLDTFTGDISTDEEISFDASAFITRPGSYTLILEADASSRDVAFGASEFPVVAARPKLVISTGGGVPPANAAPVVNAGPDRTTTLGGGQATLAINGSASDDGLPSGSSLALSWTRVSGPAAVTFSSPSSADTSATFTAAGTYVLRLSGSDGSLGAADDMSVVVGSAPAGGTQTSFHATHDAFTENGSNRNGSNLRIENTSSRKRIGYLQFDLSSAVSPINSATLTLTEMDDVSSGKMTLRLFAAASNSWTESTITGTNAPAKGAELDAVTGAIADGESVAFDVSALVTEAGIYSFILEADPSSYDVAFASSEGSPASARPVLRVNGGRAAAIVAEPDAESTGVTPPAPSVNVQPVAGQGIRVKVTGVPGQAYRIQRTGNLFEWETVKTVTATVDGTVDFLDTAPPEARAFYRLEWDD